MKKSNNLSYAMSIVLVIVLVINLVYLALGKMDVLLFWFVLIVVGLIAYKGIPYLKS